jgi:hypothetical protein
MEIDETLTRITRVRVRQCDRALRTLNARRSLTATFKVRWMTCSGKANAQS